MLSRRRFLGSLALPVAAALPASDLSGLLPAGAPGGRALEAAELDWRGARAAEILDTLRRDRRPAVQVARDEELWRELRHAFTLDRTLVNLNNGGVSPAPIPVQAAMARYLARSNEAPVYTMWRLLEPGKEVVRERLARSFGCHTEEMAITRNASEGLQICQFGLDLEPGDEVLTTNHDYPRMINTFRQRERREGIVLRQFDIPVPAEDDAEVVRRFEEHITDRTRVILMCHMINITGQILPVRGVVQMARARGIPVIVDGAHAYAHFDFHGEDLDCDYYATSLHKWLFAPFGTGFLHVRQDRIEGLWPLMASHERQDRDIRKFEEVGTHPCPNYLAIGEALTFHEGIGPERKEARLVHLRNAWAEELLRHDRVRLFTSLRPGFAAGIATVGVAGVSPGELAERMWGDHRILVTPINAPGVEGVRVSPSVYTTVEELERFVDAMEGVVRAT